MAEKKIQENPLPDIPEPADKVKDMADKSQVKIPETKVVVQTTVVAEAPQTGHGGMFTIHKTPPNDLYRRLLPAVLFLMTFVTVMTMLLIYMDTVALGAQQFRLNMSRDYELRRINQDEPSFVLYVRQRHLRLRTQPAVLSPNPEKTNKVELLDEIFGSNYNGTFVEIMPSGGRDPTTWYLERVRGWQGVVARASPQDYLALRGLMPALDVCLSPTDHPREVTYHSESDAAQSGFKSRVLCLPLYTTLLAASATRTDFLLLAGEHAPSALRTLPFNDVHIPVIEVRFLNNVSRNKTTEYLLSQNYTVKADFEDGVMYTLVNSKNIA